ncbi:hypothetical protein GCM10027091_75270 [Streptomyces daliensis]
MGHMTAVVIVILVLVVVALAAGALYMSRAKGGGKGGLKRRFGPEYERVLARHNGDVKAAEHELDERVRRYGRLRLQPLTPEVREQYLVRWAGAQERFVDSPNEAIAEADQLLAGLAQERGFPGVDRPDEHMDALSVHHAHHIHGYRMVHAAAHGRAGTEGMREAMLEARALFDALAEDRPATAGKGRRPVTTGPGTAGSGAPGSATPGGTATPGTPAPGSTAPGAAPPGAPDGRAHANDGRTHSRWPIGGNRRHRTRGSETP